MPPNAEPAPDVQLQSRRRKRAVHMFGALVVASAVAFAAFFMLGGKAGVLALLYRVEAAAVAAPLAAMAVYTAVCLVSQTMVIPSGTLLVLAGGYLLGAGAAAGILSVAALAASILVYAIAREAFSRTISEYAQRTPERQKALDALRQEGASAVAALRLAPIVPNAVAASLAAGAGIPFWTFMTVSALTIWVRPLAVASLGASMRELADAARGVPASLGFAMGGLFLTALLVLGLRLVLRMTRA